MRVRKLRGETLEAPPIQGEARRPSARLGEEALPEPAWSALGLSRVDVRCYIWPLERLIYVGSDGLAYPIQMDSTKWRNELC